MITEIIFFALTSVILMISSTFLVTSLNKIAHYLRISKFTAAFIIMAFATSIPELFIGISSAIAKTPEISLGNLIGSSIVHTTILMGMFVLMNRGIKVKDTKIGKDIFFVIGSVLLIIILFLIGKSLSRIDGIILLLFFTLSYYTIFKKSRQHKEKLKKQEYKRYKIIGYSFTFIISLFVLFFTSNYLVKFTGIIATQLGFPELLIGILLLSISTNLPEIAFGYRAYKMGYKELIVGDLTGGTLVNIGLVLGIVAIITPITTPTIPFLITSCFLFLSSLIFLIFLRTDRELKTIEGIFLILLYLLFLIIEFFMRL
ncbi:MAG: hypothetical protein WC438_02610 [Candidatus Pacearchaeota archaeon]